MLVESYLAPDSGTGLRPCNQLSHTRLNDQAQPRSSLLLADKRSSQPPTLGNLCAMRKAHRAVARGAFVAARCSSSKQPNVRSGKCIHLANRAHRDVMGRPVTHSPYATKTFDDSVDVAEGAEQVWIVDGSLGDRLECQTARRGHCEINIFQSRELGCRRKHVRKSRMMAMDFRQGVSMEAHQLAGKSTCSDDTDLLSQHSADRNFKTVPTSRGTKARPLSHKWCELRIRGKVRINCFDVRAEIEKPPNTSDTIWEQSDIWKPNCHTERLFLV